MSIDLPFYYPLHLLITMTWQQKYTSCEEKLNTEIKKFALALMVSGKFTHSVNFDGLLNEVRTNNVLMDILYILASKESQKLVINLIVDGTLGIDWYKMSQEPELSRWIIDLYGQELNWQQLLLSNEIPEYLVKKHQNKFDEAISNLLYDII